jgi:hypothetical protein
MAILLRGATPLHAAADHTVDVVYMLPQSEEVRAIHAAAAAGLTRQSRLTGLDVCDRTNMNMLSHVTVTL